MIILQPLNVQAIGILKMLHKTKIIQNQLREFPVSFDLYQKPNLTCSKRNFDDNEIYWIKNKDLEEVKQSNKNKIDKY